MARIKPSIIGIKGKFEDRVFVDSNKIKPYVRKAPKAGAKKHEPAFKQQHERTPFLNKLAGEINSIFKRLAPTIRHQSFYRKLQKQLRREPLSNRFLLLVQTKGMELHPKHRFDSLGHCQLQAHVLNNKLVVELHGTSHPEPGRYRANSYYYEVVLISWDKSEGPAEVACQYSDWINMKEGEPIFEFEFSLKKGTRHWLISLRQQLGVNKKKIESVKTEGMKIVEVGSLDKSDLEILREREEERKIKSVKKKEEKEPARVKAKRFIQNKLN
jgi:hypothetical protein